MRGRVCKVYGVLVLLVISCAPTRAYRHAKPLAQLTHEFPNVTCNFESSCSWKWSSDSFTNTSSSQLQAKFKDHDPKIDVPTVDGDNKEEGHFLFIFDTNQRKRELNITSPEIDPRFIDTNNDQFCSLSLSLRTHPRQNGNISVLIQEGNRTKVIMNQLNIDDDDWQTRRINLGHPEELFRIIVEIGSTPFRTSYVAIDNIELKNCFPDFSNGHCPNKEKFHCKNDSVCIPMNMVCDINRDCSDASDEKHNCDKVPPGTRCTFENGWCGWKNSTEKQYTLKWKLNRGPTKNKMSGPSYDHTFANETGTYAYVDMSHGPLGSLALMESIYLNPPPPVHSDQLSPYFNSCYITFFYHKYGPHSGSLGLYIKEERPDGPRNGQRIWWSYGNKGDKWLRQVVVLPSIKERYTLQFEARKATSPRGDVAVDDIAFSPSCFGIGIPPEHLNGYTYADYPKSQVYSITTCNSTGSRGPSQENCDKFYKNTTTQVTVQNTSNIAGIQKWVVPETSFYTILAKGARGGKGADALGESRSALVRVVTELQRGEEIYMLVGQEGQDACQKLSFDTPSCVVDFHYRTTANFKNLLQNPQIRDGGGGGGGGTYIFRIIDGEAHPILVAAGGGGLAHGPFFDDGRQHGNGQNASLPNITAPSIGKYPAGAGGGWMPGNFSINNNSSGKSLLEGGVGGAPCYYSSDKMKGTGGFGGGGGGCVAGGGGGGFTGGRAWSDSSINGEGGWSMIASKMQHKEVKPRFHYGPGTVLIIPAVQGCDCDHKCIALDEARSKVQCICPSQSYILSTDGKKCVFIASKEGSVDALSISWALILSTGFACIMLTFGIILLLRRCQEQQKIITNRKVCGGGLQLNPLNVQSVRLTEYNPNYEFGGNTYTLRDLKEIPREKIQLVKPLGCGAFGDVYQGLLKNRDNDSVDLAVAVKILPALCSNQAENDFFMEAIIMSKFNHPNIVHFIGACFDTHPRYIILELLAGGDLKNFLRENRPKVDKPSALTMKDLLQCAIDVAKGCQYLEELHFIHRDIAARNCLLTSRGPGRVVKIADFGMSRDIYRSDYYKKGGKAMLPIKWMPPEAFLDGIFSSKTDVWSFGVLLWEVMSLGFMPYTGIRNREVMMYVARGARLGAPANCPPPVFSIMGMCWSQDPEERPTFATIVERLGYCIQDPGVINTQLPVYKGPLPSELDKTLMRPKSEEDYVQTDYMIPIMPDTPVEWTDKGLDILHKYVVEDDKPKLSLSLDETSSTNSSNSNLPPVQNPMQKFNSLQQNSTTKLSPQMQPNSNFKSESNTKIDDSRSKPFVLSGQFVKDPQIK